MLKTFIQKAVYHILSIKTARNVFPKIYKPFRKRVVRVRSHRPCGAVGTMGQT